MQPRPQRRTRRLRRLCLGCHAAQSRRRRIHLQGAGNRPRDQHRRPRFLQLGGRQLAQRHDAAADDPAQHPARPQRQRRRHLHLRLERGGVELRMRPRRRPFTSCPSAGITYSGLANGPHSFQVRATDPSANVDPTPAGYSFSVTVAPAEPVPGTPAPTPAPAGPAPPAPGRPDHSHRQAWRRHPRPHPELPLPRRRGRRQLRVRRRQGGLQAVPLPVHRQVAEARAPHLHGAGAGRRPRRSLAGEVQLQGSRGALSR